MSAGDIIMQTSYILVLIIGLSCVLSGTALSADVLANTQYSFDDETGNAVEKDELKSSYGIQYTVQFYKYNYTLFVDAHNPNDHDVNYSGFVVMVDNHELLDLTKNFSSDEYQSWKIGYLDGVNTLKRNHTVTISTYGDSTEFSLTKEFELPNSGPVPTPYIDEVTITNGTIDGEPSAVAKVTVVNPSIHPYPLKLMVHTLGTDGSFYGASVPPGGQDTITVELLDERGAQIAGEARLYAGNLSEGDGAMDQVGFVGRAGEDTKTWNETYEPIKGPWRSDGYEYRNETLEEESSLVERLSGGYDVFGIPAVYLIAGLGLGFLLFRWRR